MAFEKILVAIDGFAPSLGAFKKAAELAKERGGEVIALQVEEKMPLLPAEKFLEVSHDGIVTEAPLTLAKAYGKLNGIKVKTVKLSGPVAGAILEEAKREDVDLIVLGDSGHKGFEKLYLGSVAQAVIENSKRPVTVVKTGWVDISDLAEIAKKIKKKEEIKPIPELDESVVKENFSFTIKLFTIFTLFYFFAAIIASKPFKNIAAIEIIDLPFGIWSGFGIFILGIYLTRMYMKKSKFVAGGEQ